MNRKHSAIKRAVVLGLFAICVLAFSNAFAGDRYNDRGYRGWSRSLPPHHEVVVVGRQRYHYNDGRFYRPGWFGFGFTIAAPPFGAVVRVLPFGYRTIPVGRGRYYWYNNVYYTDYPSGYLVVPPPVPVQPGTISGNTVIINIPNVYGSYIPVTLIRQGNGFIGPRGEYYSSLPTSEQLRSIYGR